MRTTLTLDPDVARMLEEEAVVNDAIRRGLAPRLSSRSQTRYRVRPHKTTLQPGIDAGSFNKRVDELEDEAVVARMRKPR